MQVISWLLEFSVREGSEVGLLGGLRGLWCSCGARAFIVFSGFRDVRGFRFADLGELKGFGSGLFCLGG